MQMRMQKRKYFSSFSYELGEKQEQREQRKKELGVKLVNWAEGVPWAPYALVLIEERHH